MEIVALKQKVDNNINRIIAKFVGFPPVQTSKIISQAINEYEYIYGDEGHPFIPFHQYYFDFYDVMPYYYPYCFSCADCWPLCDCICPHCSREGKYCNGYCRRDSDSETDSDSDFE